MPVTVPITVADPPAAPVGYTLCAFEVRTIVPSDDVAVPGLGRMEPVAVFAGTTAGFEESAAILFKAVQASLRDVGVGLRLAAVAWWIDSSFEKCEPGRERMVSVYDAKREEWGEWKPEEKLGGPAKIRNPSGIGRGSPGQTVGNRKIR